MPIHLIHELVYWRAFEVDLYLLSVFEFYTKGGGRQARDDLCGYLHIVARFGGNHGEEYAYGVGAAGEGVDGGGDGG